MLNTKHNLLLSKQIRVQWRPILLQLEEMVVLSFRYESNSEKTFRPAAGDSRMGVIDEQNVDRSW